jgi:outer membrane receptor protein involved in Fe transport
MLPASLWNALLPSLMLASAPTPRSEADTLVRTQNPERYQVVVTATKLPTREEEVPNAVTVVSGDELRRRGTHTVAEALQDVVGLDTGEGSDSGPSVPNVGLWGLKEFDALLFTVDGMPVGGPFNPSLTQIPVEDVERIEVVKGPQGTLYGVSAFAGMVQVLTRGGSDKLGTVSIGAGSFSTGRAKASLWRDLGGNTSLRLTGAVQRAQGGQDRTGTDEDRAALTLAGSLGSVRTTLDLTAYRNTQPWGTPLPFDQGAIVPGFEIDRNYAVGGAVQEHRVAAANLRLSAPLQPSLTLDNTLSIYRDRQNSIRSFVDFEAATGNTVPSEGVSIRPIETSLFDEVRMRSGFDASGRHDLLVGAAITWGRVTADGIGFDFDQVVGDPSSIPDVGAIPAGDVRSFHDRRTFVGVYARDEWTPVPRVTISGGARYDNTSEALHAQAQEQSPPGQPLETSDDTQTNSAWSGDVAGLLRLLAEPKGAFDAVNAYANWKSAFKPAAPNLSEAEGAEILEPERTHSVEVGIKTRALRRQLSLDLSVFDMRFENMVVSTLDASSNPILVNAGKERFKGFEAELSYRPGSLPSTVFSGGYAYHDATFEEFTFVTPSGELRDVSGNNLELVPHDLVNARVDVRAPKGFGFFGAVRWQGERPLNRRNTFFADPFTEFDAGASFRIGECALSVIERNLGDDRHGVTESELGDSQFYVAPPRRVSAELSIGF